MKWVFCSLFLLTLPLSAGTLRFYNDSLVPLQAVIYSAKGAMLGDVYLDPNNGANWSDSEGDFFYSNEVSLSPYTVQWVCTSGGIYASCNSVAEGAMVTSQGCDGLKMCQ